MVENGDSSTACDGEKEMSLNATSSFEESTGVENAKNGQDIASSL